MELKTGRKYLSFKFSPEIYNDVYLYISQMALNPVSGDVIINCVHTTMCAYRPMSKFQSMSSSYRRHRLVLMLRKTRFVLKRLLILSCFCAKIKSVSLCVRLLLTKADVIYIYTSGRSVLV